MKPIGYLGALLGCVLANYGYQAAHDEVWALAFDRSYFQASAVLAVWLCNYFYAPVSA